MQSKMADMQAELETREVEGVSDGGLVRVRLRRVEAQQTGGSKPVVLAEATRSLATGAVTLDQG